MATVTVRLIIFARCISLAVAGSGQLICTGIPSLASSPNLILSAKSGQLKLVPLADPLVTTVTEFFPTLNWKLPPDPPVIVTLSRTQ